MLIYGNKDGWVRLVQIAKAFSEAVEKKDVPTVLWLLHITNDITEQMEDFNKE